MKDNGLRLYKNMFNTDTPARELQATLLAKYIKLGSIPKGSLLEKVVVAGYSPLQVIFNQQTFACTYGEFNEQNEP